MLSNQLKWVETLAAQRNFPSNKLKFELSCGLRQHLSKGLRTYCVLLSTTGREVLTTPFFANKRDYCKVVYISLEVSFPLVVMQRYLFF